MIPKSSSMLSMKSSRNGIMAANSSNDSFSNHSRRRMRKSSSVSQVGRGPMSVPESQGRRDQFRKNQSWGDVQRSQPGPRSRFSSGLGEKTVSFDEVVMVRPALPRSRYSIEEINRCWYKKQDKKRFTEEIKETVKHAKDKKKLGNDISLRGLEKYAPMAKAYEERRKQTVRAVLWEQAHQRKSTNGAQNAVFAMDNTKLRKVYRKGTKPAQTLAHAMGKVDQLEVSRLQKTWGASVFGQSGLEKVVAEQQPQKQKRRRSSGLRNMIRGM